MSIFIGKIFSLNMNITLRTTANIDLNNRDMWSEITSSDFDVRYEPNIMFIPDEFIVVFYEQVLSTSCTNMFNITSPSGVLLTNDTAFYDIQLESNMFNSVDFIVVQGHDDTIIRVYDASK
jgi:hypothetical protein